MKKKILLISSLIISTLILSGCLRAPEKPGIDPFMIEEEVKKEVAVEIIEEVKKAKTITGAKLEEKKETVKAKTPIKEDKKEVPAKIIEKIETATGTNLKEKEGAPERSDVGYDFNKAKKLAEEENSEKTEAEKLLEEEMAISKKEAEEKRLLEEKIKKEEDEEDKRIEEEAEEATSN